MLLLGSSRTMGADPGNYNAKSGKVLNAGQSRSACMARYIAFGFVKASSDQLQIPLSDMRALRGQWLHAVTVSDILRARPDGASKGWHQGDSKFQLAYKDEWWLAM